MKRACVLCSTLPRAAAEQHSWVAYRDLGLDYRGSVAFHLRMLKRAGFVTLRKGQDGFEGRRRTIVRMTPAGVA